MQLKPLASGSCQKMKPNYSLELEHKGGGSWQGASVIRVKIGNKRVPYVLRTEALELVLRSCGSAGSQHKVGKLPPREVR